jgi:glucose dehydrogenase
MTDVSDSGILTTATDVLFTGGREGYFQALDARTGELLWKTNLGGQIVTAPMTYQVDGKQYVTTIAGQVMVTFGLRE